MDTTENAFYKKGWCKFSHDSAIEQWISEALPLARNEVTSNAHKDWLRCGGTWFVGVNALPNNSDGVIGNSKPLSGKAVEFIRGMPELGNFDWDRAQISICYPGYPAPSDAETEQAFQFRKNRDSAHLDGLLPEGPERRRYLRETHGFILGIPMVEYSDDASPLVVWEGSHEIIRTAFNQRFSGIAPNNWGNEDVTEHYQRIRKKVFDQCEKIIIHASPGETFLIHRLSIHGIAPWKETATAGSDGRMICYFRPDLSEPEKWLSVK